MLGNLKRSVEFLGHCPTRFDVLAALVDRDHGAAQRTRAASASFKGRHRHEFDFSTDLWVFEFPQVEHSVDNHRADDDTIEPLFVSSTPP